MTRKHITAYWLIPAKPEHDLFRSLIRVLAREFNSEPFAPHLTICFKPGRQPAAKILRQIKAGPIRLSCKEIAYSPRFTKTLFVRFKSDPAAKKLCADLGGNVTALSDPHLSLVYKKLPVNTKKELVATIKLPIRTVTFDRLMAVYCVSPTKTGRDVKNWQVIVTKRLST